MCWNAGGKGTLKLEISQSTRRQSGRNCARQLVQKHTSRDTNIERSQHTHERQGERTAAGSHGATPLLPLPPLSSTSVRHLVGSLSTRSFPIRESGASFQRRCFAFTFLPSNNDELHFPSRLAFPALPSTYSRALFDERFAFVSPTPPISFLLPSHPPLSRATRNPSGMILILRREKERERDGDSIWKLTKLNFVGITFFNWLIS